MEVVSNRSDRDSNLPEYYQQPSYQRPGYQPSPERQPSYQHDPPKEPDYSTQSAAYAPTAYTPTAQSTAGDEKNSRHRLPFGCTPLVFGVVTALTTAIIVGAAVGGGVGGAMSKSNTDCKTSATQAAAFGDATATTTVFQSMSSSGTPTSTTSPETSTSSGPASDYSALAYTKISGVDLDCPALDSKNYSSGWESQLFNLNCDFLYNGGDIASVFVYSWQECVEACASINHYTQREGAGSTCTHALFQAEVTDSVITYHRNCWLKGDGAVIGTADSERRLLTADLLP